MSAKKPHSPLFAQAANRRRLRKMLKQMLAGGSSSGMRKAVGRMSGSGQSVSEFDATA